MKWINPIFQEPKPPKTIRFEERGLKKTNLPGGYQQQGVGPNSKGGQMTISRHLLRRQFASTTRSARPENRPRLPKNLPPKH
ncbi:MAG: hypothetical protein ACERKU_02590, partial [Nitrospirota bacterium]